jgi:hypothetical protein
VEFADGGKFLVVDWETLVSIESFKAQLVETRKVQRVEASGGTEFIDFQRDPKVALVQPQEKAPPGEAPCARSSRSSK